MQIDNGPPPSILPPPVAALPTSILHLYLAEVALVKHKQREAVQRDVVQGILEELSCRHNDISLPHFCSERQLGSTMDAGDIEEVIPFKQQSHLLALLFNQIDLDRRRDFQLQALVCLF